MIEVEGHAGQHLNGEAEGKSKDKDKDKGKAIAKDSKDIGDRGRESERR